jgi:hypothetical protein
LKEPQRDWNTNRANVAFCDDALFCPEKAMAHRIIKVPNLPVKSFLAYSSAVVFGAFASIAAARTETGSVVLGLVAIVALIVGYLGRDQEKPPRKTDLIKS